MGRTEFTREEKAHLVRYLAEVTPGGKSRKGNKVYTSLVESLDRYPWAKTHSWHSWREQYVKNEAIYDRQIRKELEKQIASAASSFTIVDPAASGSGEVGTSAGPSSTHAGGDIASYDEGGPVFPQVHHEGEGEHDVDVGSSELGLGKRRRNDGDAKAGKKTRKPRGPWVTGPDVKALVLHIVDNAHLSTEDDMLYILLSEKNDKYTPEQWRDFVSENRHEVDKLVQNERRRRADRAIADVQQAADAVAASSSYMGTFPVHENDHGVGSSHSPAPPLDLLPIFPEPDAAEHEHDSASAPSAASSAVYDPTPAVRNRRTKSASASASASAALSDFDDDSEDVIPRKKRKKRHTADFTPEDDRIVAFWLSEHETSRMGNKIWQQLEELNNRHTWHAWRNRFVHHQDRLLTLARQLKDGGVRINVRGDNTDEQDEHGHGQGSGVDHQADDPVARAAAAVVAAAASSSRSHQRSQSHRGTLSLEETTAAAVAALPHFSVHEGDAPFKFDWAAAAAASQQEIDPQLFAAAAAAAAAAALDKDGGQAHQQQHGEGDEDVDVEVDNTQVREEADADVLRGVRELAERYDVGQGEVVDILMAEGLDTARTEEVLRRMKEEREAQA